MPKLNANVDQIELTLNKCNSFSLQDNNNDDEDYPTVNAVKNVMNNTFADYVVETGTDGLWNYRKWKSGIAECWFVTEQRTVTISTVWGNLYTCDNAFPNYIYPFKFIELPSIHIHPILPNNDVNYNFWLFTGKGATVNQTPSVSLVRPLENTVVASLSYYVIGKWK